MKQTAPPQRLSSPDEEAFFRAVKRDALKNGTPPASRPSKWFISEATQMFGNSYYWTENENYDIIMVEGKGKRHSIPIAFFLILIFIKGACLLCLVQKL